MMPSVPPIRRLLIPCKHPHAVQLQRVELERLHCRKVDGRRAVSEVAGVRATLYKGSSEQYGKFGRIGTGQTEEEEESTEEEKEHMEDAKEEEEHIPKASEEEKPDTGMEERNLLSCVAKMAL
ncbi:hypothetical protein BC830DRAFT_1220183 [Chytriomyces sp. MP71]|nr:hypothetical protein BC830DRAFT_1220183 [Chytriomyces sp. MP71]